MKNHPWKSIAALAAVLLAWPAAAQTRYSSQPNACSVKIDGSSTTHDWEMEGKMIGGFIELGSSVKFDATLKDGPIQAKSHAIIPITSIHSKAEHMPNVMDNLMKDALRGDQFPRIEYTLTGMTFKGPHSAAAPYNFDTTGELTIGGVTNKVSFPITIQTLDEGKIKLNASVPLKMTSYKVDPPAPNIGLGLMKCADDVKIIIDWTLKERK